MNALKSEKNMFRLGNQKSIAISFVNGSLSTSVFNSIGSSPVKDIEKTPYGNSYRLMNIGYHRLSEIAWHVSSKESAFFLIGQAFESINLFFRLLEAQRNDLESYSYACLYKEQYPKGLLLLLVSKLAVRWQKRFLKEYETLNIEIW